MTTVTATLRAAIYTRVSQDASGVARSPREQEAESRRDCERNGWTVAAVYTDNDRSASRHARKTRPDYARLLADIAAGNIDILVVWEASRLTRDLEAYAALAGACRSAGVRLSYGGKLLNLDNPDDEFTVGLDMLLAQRESGVARKRILRNVRANAEAGRPHGKVQFGYLRVYDTHRRYVEQIPDPQTAPVVVELFTRIAAGHTICSIARDLNTRGVLTSHGTTWAATKVRQTVQSRSYLGHRLHRGQVTVEKAWPALVDDTLFYRVQAILGDPSRRQSHDTRAKYLLTGLLRCEPCGSPVVHANVGRNGRRIHVYRCKAAGHVTKSAGPLEEGIRHLVAARLARADALAAFTPRAPSLDGVHGERRALTARLDEADDALATGELSPRAHGKLEARLRPRLDELTAMMAARQPGTPAPVLDLAALATPAQVEARFAELDLAARRLVIRHMLRDLTLRGAPASRRRTDLGIRFRWVGTDTTTEA